MSGPGLAALEASLRRRFRTTTTRVGVAGRAISILHPASAEELIDEQAFERDERLPYWADIWPSARVLGEHLFARAGAGRTCLELGCGAGLVATCAALAGFDVIASDYYEDAIAFTRVNADRNGAPPVRGRLLDWRHLPADPPRADLVVASDVLYERSYGDVVARVLGATLGDAGVALVADPGRVGRDAFLRALGSRGLAVARRTEAAFEEPPIRQTITIFEVARVTLDSATQVTR